jgi:hypothetical protein
MNNESEDVTGELVPALSYHIATTEQASPKAHVVTDGNDRLRGE